MKGKAYILWSQICKNYPRVNTPAGHPWQEGQPPVWCKSPLINVIWSALSLPRFKSWHRLCIRLHGLQLSEVSLAAYCEYTSRYPSYGCVTHQGPCRRPHCMPAWQPLAFVCRTLWFVVDCRHQNGGVPADNSGTCLPAWWQAYSRCLLFYIHILQVSNVHILSC